MSFLASSLSGIFGRRAANAATAAREDRESSSPPPPEEDADSIPNYDDDSDGSDGDEGGSVELEEEDSFDDALSDDSSPDEPALPTRPSLGGAPVRLSVRRCRFTYISLTPVLKARLWFQRFNSLNPYTLSKRLVSNVNLHVPTYR